MFVHGTPYNIICCYGISNCFVFALLLFPFLSLHYFTTNLPVMTDLWTCRKFQDQITVTISFTLAFQHAEREKEQKDSK